MSTSSIALPLLVGALAMGLRAQHAIVFTGQLPLRSLDAVHERPGGAINQISEYDFAIAIPGATAARTLLPATAMQCYLGDGDFDGDYLKLRTWRQGYAQPLGIGGLFVRAADRQGADWRDVFFTIRRGPGVVGQEFEAFVAGNTPYLMAPGDWLRLRPMGFSQWFLAPGQLLLAAGAQPTPTSVGSVALLQSNAGDLFYSPSDGGHWVQGNGVLPVFAEEGSLCRIDAGDITYDAAGNVAGIAAGSARLIADRQTVLAWVQHAGAYDRNGAPLQATAYGLTTGLAFDPLGGTFVPSHPGPNGAYAPQPNVIFCSQTPAYGGTLFSSRNGGEVARINGVLCGSTTAGVPADGSWLGVDLDPALDQPSLLGMTLVEIPPLSTPLLLDHEDYGAVPPAASAANVPLDLHGVPGMPVFVWLAAGPAPPQAVLPTLPATALPFALAAQSWSDVLLSPPVFLLATAMTDSQGYATVSMSNPNAPGYAGVTLMLQAMALAPTGVEISSPLLLQLQ